MLRNAKLKFRSSGLRLLATGAAILAFTTLLIIARTSFSLSLENKNPAPQTNVPPARKPAPDLPRRRDDLAVGREIDRAIDESELTQARWGVFVMAVDDGRTVYSRN